MVFPMPLILTSFGTSSHLLKKWLVSYPGKPVSWASVEKKKKTNQKEYHTKHSSALFVYIYMLFKTKCTFYGFTGAPCNRETGYCDKFKRCQIASVDKQSTRISNCQAGTICKRHIAFVLRVSIIHVTMLD